MFINRIVFLFLFISHQTFSQTKKKADTIFVYEKVFVYKTISKNIKRIQCVGFDSITGKEFATLKPFKTAIVADTASLKILAAAFKKDSKKKDIKRVIIYNYGISIQALISQQPEIKNYGVGMGLFAAKSIYKNRLFLNLELVFSKVFGVTNVNAIEGYYITPDAVLLYKPKNVNTQQFNLPITLSWKYRKIKPQIGIAFSQKKTGLDFFAYRNNSVVTTIERSTYQLTNNYVDFVYGIEYDVSKRIGLYLKSKQTLLKINNNKVNENLKSLEELHFFPNQVIFGVNYNLKK